MAKLSLHDSPTKTVPVPLDTWERIVDSCIAFDLILRHCEFKDETTDALGCIKRDLDASLLSVEVPE